MSLGHQTLRYTKEDSYAVLLSLLLKTHPIVIVKKQRTHTPALSRFCSGRQKSRGVCVLKARVCFYTSEQQGWEGLLPPALPTASSSMLPAAEGAFVSDFLVSGSGKGSWWEQKRLSQDGERMWMCSCGWGWKGWRLRAHSAWWRNRNPYLAPGLFNIHNKILNAKGLFMGLLWVNSLGISVSLLILIF